MARSKFKTRMRGVRLESVPFPADRMRLIAENTLAKIRDRISYGMDVNDQTAPELSRSYAKFKTQRMKRPDRRDWFLTGITLGHLKVKSAEPNRAVMGFLPGIRRYSRKSKLGEIGKPLVDRSVPISLVVSRNQKRRRQWGMSPSDSAVLQRAIQGFQFIKAVKSA